MRLRSFRLRLLLLPLVVLSFPGPTDAQEQGDDPSTLGITALQQRASDFAMQTRFQAARPFLQEIVNRLEEGTPEEQDTLGPVFFFLGLGYLQEYSQTAETALLQNAVDSFTKALEFGVEEEREISLLEFRGDAYRGLGKFEEAAADYRKLASAPLARRLRPEDEREVLEKLALSYQVIKNWDEAIPWLRRFLETAKGDEQRALAAGLLLEAYIEQENTEEILALLPLITVDNPSRYNISLNVALLQAGDKLSAEGQYAEAALLYAATLTREEILRYLEEREAAFAREVERMRNLGSSEERMSDEVYALEDVRRKIKAVREVQPYTSQLMARVARNYYLAGRDYEAIWGYLRFVENYPDDPSAEDLLFAAFMTAANVGLEDLAREIGERLLESETVNEDYRKRVLIVLARVYLENEDEGRFFDATDDYLDAFPESVESGQVVFLVGNYLVNRGRFDELIERFEDRLEELDGTPAEDGLLYWMGLARIFDSKFAEARERFETVLDDFPESVYREDSLYRLAMTHYGQDQTDEAREVFERFVEEYPDAELRGEVEFFLGEIAASGGELIEAVEHYDQVPEFTGNIDFITSAYFQKARLFERNDIFKRAVATYEEYVDRYGEEGQLTRAIFRLGEALKELGRPGDAIVRYKEAILRYGNDPDNLGVDPMIGDYVEQYDETLLRLQDTVAFLEKVASDDEFRRSIAADRGLLYQQFANNENLDRSLYEELRQSPEFSAALRESAEPVTPYLEEYRRQLEEFPSEDPLTLFAREFQQAKRSGKRTLAMRLQMALEELGNPPRDPLVLQESDLRRASPTLLVWIGNQKERVDPELAERAYREAIAYEEKVDEQVDAYNALADLLMEDGRTEEALALYEEAEANFPAHPRIYRALVAQARVFAERGRQEKAREKLLRILKTPDWRGEPHAEALYRMGKSYFDEGSYDEAHGFFERTFLGYALFEEWAARAYLMDARTLAEMGQMEDARNTLREALSDDRYEDTEVYGELVEYANNI